MSVHRIWGDLYEQEYNLLRNKLPKWASNLLLDLDLIKLIKKPQPQSAFDVSIIAQILTRTDILLKEGIFSENIWHQTLEFWAIMDFKFKYFTRNFFVPVSVTVLMHK
jgi:hypothetical protein